MTEASNREYLPRSEVETLIESGLALEANRWENHLLVHAAQKEAVEAALKAVHEQDRDHRDAHEKAHDSHEEKHNAGEESVRVALASVSRERTIHAEAHEREHAGHLGVHSLNNLAIEKAESATNQRFSAANGYREAYESRVNSAASKEALEGQRKEFDRRLTIVERNDVRSEGKGLGQSAVFAWIVTAVTLISMFTGMVVILTRGPI